MAIQAKFPKTLRALSIAGPYAYLIATGEKLSEGRSWRTHFRGIVLLHVSTGRDYGDPQSKDMISSIIGAAEVYDCAPDPEDEQYFDHWVKNPVLFKKFIPNVSGKRNYWEPSTDAHVKAFNQAWEQIQEQAPYLINSPVPTEPTATFKIHIQDGVIRVASMKTATVFELAEQGDWKPFASRVQAGEIELTKSELAALYRSRMF
jgi:hypothetical protein